MLFCRHRRPRVRADYSSLDSYRWRWASRSDFSGAKIASGARGAQRRRGHARRRGRRETPLDQLEAGFVRTARCVDGSVQRPRGASVVSIKVFDVVVYGCVCEAAGPASILRRPLQDRRLACGFCSHVVLCTDSLLVCRLIGVHDAGCDPASITDLVAVGLGPLTDRL